MAEFEYNPAVAGAKVALTSFEDPGDTMQDALLNPASLPLEIEVAVGELNPVGSSQSTLQYGHTKAMGVPIELYFSNQFQGREFYNTDPGRTAINIREDVTDRVNWLASFCYGKEPGRAPSPLLIIWPHVLNIIVVYRRFRAEYIRFARDLAPTAAKVTLDTAELRFSFKGSAEQIKQGWLKRDPLVVSGGTGSPLNFGNRR